MATKKAAVKTAKKPAPKKATKKAATKSSPKKKETFLHMIDNGETYSVKIRGNGADLVSMLKDCMEQDENIKTIIRLAAII